MRVRAAGDEVLDVKVRPVEQVNDRQQHSGAPVELLDLDRTPAGQVRNEADPAVVVPGKDGRRLQGQQLADRFIQSSKSARNASTPIERGL